MSYRAPDPREALGEPDIVVAFLSREQDRELREKANRPTKAYLDAVAPIPARGDKSDEAARLRKSRKRLSAHLREKKPHVGGRLILKKRNTKVKRGKRKGGNQLGQAERYYAGKTDLWRAFEAWALVQIDRALGRGAPEHLRRLRLPLKCPHGAHVVWRYYAPDRSAWPDHPGVAETVADLIQDAGILRDDVLIEHDDLSRRMPPDPEAPRLELWIRALDEDGNTP